METLVSRISPWLVLVLILALIISNWEKCTGGEKTEDDDGPTSGISLVELQSPVAIAIMDANRLLDEPFPTATVHLIDEGGMVVTPSGHTFSSIEIEHGLMSLALSTEANPSLETPYHFVLEVSAEGYNTNYKNILVTGTEGQYEAIFMAKLSDLPRGSAGFTGAMPMNAGQISSTLTLTPQSANGISTANLEVEVPAGLRPIYCDDDNNNKPFPENLNYQFTYGTSRNIETARTFPGGPIVANALDREGNVIASDNNSATFTTYGFITMEMDADGAEVNGFTEPITVNMPITDDMINPATGDPFEVGNEISVWSLNSSGAWREESVTTVQSGPDGLFAPMRVTHLSTWNLDSKDSPCSFGDDITLTYTNNLGVDIDRYSEVVRRSDGMVLSRRVLNYTNGGGNTHTIQRAPDGADLDYAVYDSDTGPTLLQATATPSPFTVDCSSQPTPSLTLNSTTTFEQVNIAFQVESGGSLQPVCNNTVWYLECGTCSTAALCDAAGINSFSFGGILTRNGAGTTGEITLTRPSGNFENTFCLRLWYTGLEAGTGNPVADEIIIPIDFEYDSATAVGIEAELSSGGDVDILHSYNSVTEVHLLVVTSGVDILSTCTAF